MFKESEMMYKRNELMKIIAVSMVLLFLVSGFSVMAQGSGPEKSTSSGDKSGNIFITNLRNAPVKNTPSNIVIANISVGLKPWGVAYDPSNGYVYVTNSGSNSVLEINGTTNTVIGGTYLDFGPEGLEGIAYDSSNGYAYITNWNSSGVLVMAISGASIVYIFTIAVGTNPVGVAYDPSDGYVYVANYGSNSVSVINGSTNTVIGSVAVGLKPWGVAYDPSNGYVYVANSGSNNVSVINGATNTVIGSIAVGSMPEGVACDPSNGYVYVANSGSNNVSVINGATNTVIASTRVGSYPIGVVYDPSNKCVYVANENSNNVSVITTIPLYAVAFTESGLPSGASWSVRLNGTTNSSMSNVITFNEPNGTYSYSVTSVTLGGYIASPSSGNITVNGANVNVTITFSQNKSGGYLKYTLDLYNNTLINGNFIGFTSTLVPGINPIGVAYDPSNGYLYVTEHGSNAVSIINTKTNEIIKSINVGSSPWGIAYDPSNGYLYVTNGWFGFYGGEVWYYTNNVTVINGATNTVIANISVGEGPYGILYDPSNGYIYVTNTAQNNVSVIDGANNTLIASINVGAYPEGLAYDPSNGYIYVANSWSNNVSVINGANNTVIANIAVGSYPVGLAYDPSNGYVYVANAGSNSVSVINGATNTVIASIAVRSFPEKIAYDPSNGYIYVVNSGSNNISVINGANNKIIANLSLGLTWGSGGDWGSSGPLGIAYDPSNNYLYLANTIGNSLILINGTTNTVVSNIKVGIFPGGVAFDPINDYLYVTDFNYSDWPGGDVNTSSNTVFVINGATNKIIANISVGLDPIGVAVDTSNGYVYVTNSGSNNVSVINGATNTVIANIAVGSMPYGVAYDSSNGYVYVANLGSNSVSVINSANNTVIANIAVGSHPVGVAYDPSNGYIYVANSWSHSVSVINTANNNVIANIAVGSHPVGVAYDSSNGYVYVANLGSNSVSVINGATNNVIANISVGSEQTGVAYDPSNGYLYVDEGVNLTVINGANNKLISVINVGSGGWPSTSMAYDASNGYLYVSNFILGTVSIISTPALVVKKYYTVTFTETGLPSGTSWSVTFNGTTESSSTNTITFSVPNGTYSYTIGSVSGYTASPSSGSITVNGANVNQAITFTAVTPSIYKITFTESGLPSGTTWSVTLSGVSKTANTNTIVFNEPNGTYSFTIGAINGYTATPSSGMITVNGSNVNQGITFTLNGTKVFTVTFTESGLPSGTMWYVNLSNGQSFSSTTNTITFNEPNGTYSYTISTKDKNYAPVSSSGAFTVNGANVNQAITFKAVTNSTNAITSANYLLYMIIVIVVIIAVLGGVMAMRRGKNKGGPKQWQEPPKQQPPQQ